MKSLQQHVNERLFISKNKHNITGEDFYNALKSYKGEYKLSNCTFNLRAYCKNNNIEPTFNCFYYDETDFPVNWIIVEGKNGITVTVVGENQAGKEYSYKFYEFDDFVEVVLNRNGEHRDDPITGKEHLQNIYKILVE